MVAVAPLLLPATCHAIRHYAAIDARVDATPPPFVSPLPLRHADTLADDVSILLRYVDTLPITP